MAATLIHLSASRSRLTAAVLSYLDNLAARVSELPAYFPVSLRARHANSTSFDGIRQIVHFVEDRGTFEQTLAEERERDYNADSASFEAMPHSTVPTKAEVWGPEERERQKQAPPIQALIPWDDRARARYHRAVILGDPGFGKTWLLRFEARRLAFDGLRRLIDRTARCEDLIFPIFARLPELNIRDDAFEATILNAVCVNQCSAFASYVSSNLETTRCVLLLDGWDEVPVEVPPDGEPIRFEGGYRQRLGQRLERFAKQFPKPQVLLTSRIVGYTGPPIPASEQLTLRPLGPTEVASFARAWFGEETRAANDFQALLQQYDKYIGLARIPLLLTLMCRLWDECLHRRDAFPVRLTDLFDRCIRGLICDWKQEKEQREIGGTEVAATLELLEQAAYDLFQEHKTEFQESLLRAKVLQWLEHLSTHHEFKQRNPSSLIAGLKRDGVLTIAGSPASTSLVFLHRAFQEYLTASYLASKLGEETAALEKTGCGPTPWLGLISRKAWLPEWHNVIVLIAAKATNSTPLLQLLSMQAPTPLNPYGDDHLLHRLCLAGECLGEIRPTLRNHDATGIDSITQQIIDAWWERRFDRERRSSLDRSLNAIARTSRKAVLTAVSRLGSSDFGDRNWATEELTCMGARPFVLEELTRCLQDGNLDVKFAAADVVWSLGESASRFAPLRVALLGWLNGQHDGLRKKAVEVLGRLGDICATPHLIATLQRYVDQADWWELRASAVTALSGLGKKAAEHPILNSVLKCLADPVWIVRCSAAEALGNIGEEGADGCVVRSLFDALKTNKDSSSGDHTYAAGEMARALGRMGSAAAQDEVIETMVQCLYSSDLHLREGAAEALGRIGCVATKPGALAGLLSCSIDAIEDLRRTATAAIMQLSRSDPDVVSHLLLQFTEHSDHRIRDSALGMLAKTAPSDVSDVLLSRLVEDLSSSDLREFKAAANRVRLLGPAAAQPVVLEHLADRLNHPAWEVQQLAAGALGDIGPTCVRCPRVLPKLLELLGDKLGTSMVAAEALGKIAQAEPDVFQRLTACLRDSGLRRTAAVALGRLRAKATPLLIEILFGELVGEHSGWGRYQALGALKGIEDIEAHPWLFRKLIDGVWVYGYELNRDVHSCLTELLLHYVARGARVFRKPSGEIEVLSVALLSSGQVVSPR